MNHQAACFILRAVKGGSYVVFQFRPEFVHPEPDTFLCRFFSVSYADVCYESENPAYHEVRLKGYMFNGKTEAMLSLTVRCDDAEARAIMIEILDKIDKTDFVDLMK